MEIQEIKQQLTLAEVLNHYGLKPDKHLRLLCPFHPDTIPSLQVYYKTHTCYCFSTVCPTHGKSLDVIDFIMHKEDCTKREAILKAKGLITGTASPLQELTRMAILTKMFTYFKNAVHNSPPARAYIESRSLDFTKLSIGYNTGQFHHGSRKDAGLITSCVKVGLLSPFGTNSRSGGQAYKPFAKCCICFALRNRSGQVSGLYFRSTGNDKNQRHFYLKDRSGLYPHYPKPDTTQLILTESIIDAGSLLQQEEIAKHYGILALYGTNGFTGEHIEAVKSLEHLEEIIFFLNGDEPGRKAVSKHAATLRELKPAISLSSVNVPDQEDVNSLLQGHQREIFTHLIAERTFLFSSESSNEIQSHEKKKERVKEADPRPDRERRELNARHPYKLTYLGKAAHYAILGGISKIMDSMRVTLQVQHLETRRKSRNKVDLYEDKQVERLCKGVSEKLPLRKDMLEEDIYRLTDLLDEYRETLLTTHQEKTDRPHIRPLTAKERQELEVFAKQSKLIHRLGELLGKTGIVGEAHNRIFLFLIAFSHKLPETLHALIQGSSGSGKTRLMRQVSDCMPETSVDRFTRISDKALYNFPETYFVNHLLCLEDMDGLSEEAEYSARELISGGELRSAVSVKNESGQITEGQKVVKGPVASLSCTTKGEIYEDNMSRVFLIAVDESPEQTQRIIGYQNQKAAGIIDRKKEQGVKRFLQNLVGILQPYEVINPFAGKITLPQEAHKIRRLNELFQGFIKIITVVHQYQRKKDEHGRLMATTEDIAIAIEIMFESIVLKVDELDGSLRQFFERLKTYVGHRARDYEFTRFEVRAATGCGKTQQHHNITKLVALEYIKQYGYANRGFKYKISHWDDYTALRARIKEHLQDQLEQIKSEHQGTPDRTPALPIRNKENAETRQ